MNYENVSAAIERGGSIRAASKILGKSYTAVQWWLARNGYRVEKQAVLVKCTHIDEKQGGSDRGA